MEHINDLKYLGSIDKFYQKIGVGTMELSRPLTKGDVIMVIGEVTFKKTAPIPSLVILVVNDMEIEHKTRKYVKAGESIGINFGEDRVRKGDRVFLLKSIKQYRRLLAEKAAIKEMVIEKAATEEE